ncbi:MAG: hypothetical protein ACYCYE_14430 [Clostridia bacterium]
MQKFLYSSETQSVEDDMEDMLSEKDKLQLQLVESMMEYFLGRKVKLKLPKRIRTSEEAQPNLASESPRAGSSTPVKAYI